MKLTKSKRSTFWMLFIPVSLFLFTLSFFKLIPISLTETLGFITGALTVWWTVEENIWNWPVGIANNIFFIILFLETRLYADMALQVIYIILAILGWYWWLKGGKNKGKLEVSKASLKTLIGLGLVGVIGTIFMTEYLISIHDSVPFWDALTTVLSLMAVFLLTRKHIENWYVWITADIIYIVLYAYKGLYLTGFLYFIFLVMCIEGYRQWKKGIKKNEIALVPAQAK